MTQTKRWKIAVSIMLLAVTSLSVAMAPKPKHLTMIVVPARFSVLQVATDVANKYPAVLVTYQGDATTEEPLLHAWNGREWVYVSIEDYEQAAFMQRIPSQAILVGDEKQLPEVLISASSWCPMVMSIPSIDTATLINSFGKVFGFRSSQWRWFSKRYNLNLVNLNPGSEKQSWYDRTMAENLAVSAEAEEADLYDEVPMTHVDEPIDYPPTEPVEMPVEEEVIELDGMMDETDLDELDEPEVEIDIETEDIDLPPAAMQDPAPIEEPEDWEERAIAPVPSTIK